MVAGARRGVVYKRTEDPGHEKEGRETSPKESGRDRGEGEGLGVWTTPVPEQDSEGECRVWEEVTGGSVEEDIPERRFE